MSRRPCSYTQADVRRAVKAITAAGQQVCGVRFEPGGGFVVLIGKPGEATSGDGVDQELDRFEEKHAD